MTTKKFFIFFGIVSFMLLSAGLNFAQEEQQPTQETQAVSQAQPEPELQWVWGEVVSVDDQKNEINIKYLDYETDAEKEMKISVDGKTTYEEVVSLSDIAPTDTVSVDYILSAGKNIARNIYVEKAEIQEKTEVETVPEKESQQAPPAVEEK